MTDKDKVKDLLKEQGAMTIAVGPGQAVRISLNKKGEIVKEIVQMPVKKIDPALVAKANKRFEWLINFLICRYHFVHRTLSMMRKFPDTTVSTMGVRVVAAGKFELYYNPEWFDARTDAQGVYVFVHEVLHVILHHCTTRQFDDHDLGNIAQDLAINELITEVNGICEKPRDKNGNLIGVFVDELKKQPLLKDIQNKQTAEWYYNYLRQKQKEQESKGKGKKGDGKVDLGTTMDDHGGFKEHEIADERVRALVRELDSCKMWGSMPQGDVELILQAQVKKVNWRNKMRQWWGSQLAKMKYSTRKRPNRRFGYIMPGFKKAYEDTWLVVIDTSGSTWGYGLLGQFLNIINQMVEEGVPIDMMQVDCEVQTEPKPYERRKAQYEFKGLGGTSMEPVMKVVEERKYRGVCIATDGEFAAPTKPSHAQVLWAVPKGKNPPVEWGERIYIEQV